MQAAVTSAQLIAHNYLHSFNAWISGALRSYHHLEFLKCIDSAIPVLELN